MSPLRLRSGLPAAPSLTRNLCSTTRISSLPPTHIPPVISADNSTALDSFPLLFEDQCLQLTSALSLGTNIYGLGEVFASSGFRGDVSTDGCVATIQTMWARHFSDHVDQNSYDSHLIYLEHRYNATTKCSQTHGVFLFSHAVPLSYTAGSDIILLTPPPSNVSLVEYRLIGGTLDLYFFSRPSPQKVIEYLNETREQVQRMRDADIPLEGALRFSLSLIVAYEGLRDGQVIWNNINLYHAMRDFMVDPVSFSPEGLTQHADHRPHVERKEQEPTLSQLCDPLNVRVKRTTLYTPFANALKLGSSSVLAFCYEFPDEHELFAVDRQFLVGRDILVAPVLTPNVSTVEGVFPGQGLVTWRD
ncbi:glycoside hydrolase family 31 protein [Phanerochaete carnosa HHB-10118-sp]|uniref:Glycoside hydrolase family 31 protein n=1 Tax=Phanerochaete carnosa (strain HHB-10118-sp) TaxID=650164 RepID=K5W8R3_PHACS|nr:glycoside hydrolase family 31 protein [Phanerochaete carnosa HHB-10118-sp]EKM60293.1 glycoside hydrolase family 31 protein [Phanerochaete carnosa HHB-10118-sp]